MNRYGSKQSEQGATNTNGLPDWKRVRALVTAGICAGIAAGVASNNIIVGTSTAFAVIGALIALCAPHE